MSENDKALEIMKKFNALIPRMDETEQKMCLAFGEGLALANAGRLRGVGLGDPAGAEKGA